MSNFSNIGFNLKTEDEFLQLLHLAHKTSTKIRITDGAYFVYTDGSGAEIFMQFDKKNTCIGANPHFKGISKRTVCLTAPVQRLASDLDGAFHCWAEPLEEGNPESGAYPFIFDLPDFKTIGQIDFPKTFDIQLTAFAQELSIYDNEKEYDEHQDSDLKFAIQSFIPSGLFPSDEEPAADPLSATGIFTGIIKQFERKRNALTNEEFYWLLVDTLGGEVDVVADLRYFEKEPKINGVVQGSFWLSGRLINPPLNQVKEEKSFLKKLFGR